MQSKEKIRRVVVMGIGNLLLKDDGVGIHALRALQETTSPPDGIDVELVDAATSPDLSIYVDTAIDKLIIIDAVQAHGKPGSVYRFTPDVLESEAKDVVSVHGITLNDSLGFMRVAGTLPAEVVIIGVEPEEMGWGVNLSAAVQEKLPEVVAVVLSEICRT